MVVVLAATAAVATGSIDKIQKLVQNGCVLLNDESGKKIISINADQLYVPASTIKVLTSYIALDLLGKEYRFRTECYLDSANNLFVKGYGDPYLISDEIRLLVDGLKNAVGAKIASLSIDNSFFDPDVSIPGISKSNNPYDALNGALVVNFNTINVGRDSAGGVYSAEDETPLTPLAVEKASSVAVGTKERINLSSRVDDCTRYAGELFIALLRERGFSITDTIPRVATVPAGLHPAFTYQNSRVLTDVLKGLLQYSNNFIANQIFLTAGAEKEGAPASMKKSRALFEQYIRKTLGIPAESLVMVEGSGISRDTRVTGSIMISIMDKFRPYADLLTQKNGHPVKSGTLNGVSNYVGYIQTQKGLRPFVILLNQEKNNRDAIMKVLATAP